jgi:hypothetical protein
MLMCWFTCAVFACSSLLASSAAAAAVAAYRRQYLGLSAAQQPAGQQQGSCKPGFALKSRPNGKSKQRSNIACSQSCDSSTEVLGCCMQPNRTAAEQTCIIQHRMRCAAVLQGPNDLAFLTAAPQSAQFLCATFHAHSLFCCRHVSARPWPAALAWLLPAPRHPSTASSSAQPAGQIGACRNSAAASSDVP